MKLPADHLRLRPVCVNGSAAEEERTVCGVTKRSGCPGIRVKGKRLTVEHLLDEHPHPLAALSCQRSRLACVFDGLGSDLFDAIENLFGCAHAMFHRRSTDSASQPSAVAVNQGLSQTFVTAGSCTSSVLTDAVRRRSAVRDPRSSPIT